RELGRMEQRAAAAPVLVQTRFDVQRAEEQSSALEAEIWAELVQNRRKVTRQDYAELAATAEPLRAMPGLWRCSIGSAPERMPGPAQGRRQSHATNSARSQRGGPRRRRAQAQR
ncbi:MAG TPA: hypothetical protein VJU61_15355, partial [Polyangiaceae bacterium]|nr:hypothetical protein [Polyangiaceae bacterium]